MKCCDFKASDFRTTVELQRRSRVADGQGGWSEGWVTVRKIPTKWASALASASMTERVFAMQLQAEAKWRCYMRYTTPLPQADQRVVYKGLAYNIIGATDVEMMGKIIEISLEQGVAI